MLDFPWRTVSLQEGNQAGFYDFLVDVSDIWFRGWDGFPMVMRWLYIGLSPPGCQWQMKV